jgi:uncharacterized tellurite resistance protein B-like protein
MDQRRLDLLHKIAYLYCFFAHSTDSDFSLPEKEMIAERMRQWMSDVPKEEFQKFFATIVLSYMSHSQSMRNIKFAEITSQLRDDAVLDPQSKQELLFDLIEIAKADGIVLDSEREFIETTAMFWEVDLKGKL